MTFASLIKSTFKTCCSKEDYTLIRNTLREYGVDKFKQEMTNLQIFRNERITSDGNFFAKIISGAVDNPCKDLSPNNKFVVFQNRVDNQENWNNYDKEWLGKASMSKGHNFLSPIDDQWSLFNVLTLGMDPTFDLQQSIKFIDNMEHTAHEYAKGKNWNKVGLYFHCYPFNSIQTLHLHVIDLDNLGPNFDYFQFKNLSLADVRQVLNEELIKSLSKI